MQKELISIVKQLIIIVIVGVCCYFFGYSQREKPEIIKIADPKVYNFTSSSSTHTIKEIVKEIPLNVDTEAILQDYFVKREYHDTIINDTNITVLTRFDVEKNRVSSPYVSTYKINRPTIEHNIYPPKNRLLIGSILTFSSTTTLSGVMLYTPKKGNISYLGQYNISTKQPSVGILFKVK